MNGKDSTMKAQNHIMNHKIQTGAPIKPKENGMRSKNTMQTMILKKKIGFMVSASKKDSSSQKTSTNYMIITKKLPYNSLKNTSLTQKAYPLIKSNV